MRLTVDPYNVAFYSWVFTKQMKMYAHMKTSMLMIIADLFMIAKNQIIKTNICKQNDKSIVYLYIGILLNNKNKQITEPHKMNKSYEHYAHKRTQAKKPPTYRICRYCMILFE